MIKRVKFFSLMSSAIGTSAIPYFYYNSMIDMSTFSFTSVASVMLLSYSIISPIVLHLVAKRYAIEISYDPKDDNYSLYTYSFWCRKKEVCIKKIEECITQFECSSEIKKPSTFRGYLDDPNFIHHEIALELPIQALTFEISFFTFSKFINFYITSSVIST